MCKSTSCSGRFWLEVEMLRKCTPLLREAHVQLKMHKALPRRSTFWSWAVEKVHTIVARSACQVKMLKAPHVWTTFGRSGVVSQGRRNGFCTLSKVSKTWRFRRSFNNVGRSGTFEADLRRCISRGRRSTRDTGVRDIRRSRCWVPERGCFWSIGSSGLLRWFCVTGAALYDLASLSSWQAPYFRQMRWKHRKTHWHKLCAQLSIFKGSLEELLCFWYCQQLSTSKKMKKSVSLFTLSSSIIEEVARSCFILDVFKFKKWGSLEELLRFQTCR